MKSDDISLSTLLTFVVLCEHSNRSHTPIQVRTRWFFFFFYLLARIMHLEQLKPKIFRNKTRKNGKFSNKRRIASEFWSATAWHNVNEYIYTYIPLDELRAKESQNFLLISTIFKLRFFHRSTCLNVIAKGERANNEIHKKTETEQNEREKNANKVHRMYCCVCVSKRARPP